MDYLDLRSDTVTQPSPAMRDVMAAAAVGDDVYGEDPSINALEHKVAQLLGKDSALLCTSGTQSNLCGLLSHCRNGEEYIVGQEYHTYRYEAGGAAVVGGIVPQPMEVDEHGTIDLELLEKRIKPNDPHFPITKLLAFENTHAGQLIDQSYFLHAAEIAAEYGLSLHLDGARLVNASIASGLSLAELSEPFDSVSICCSKGLGAPMGSLLVGSQQLIERARRWRKMLGGGMRQAGIIAAGIDYALDNNLERIKKDHDNARWLAQQLETLCSDNNITIRSTATNMLYVELPSAATALELASFMAQKDIKVPSSETMRLVTHLDASREQLQYFVDCFDEFLSEHSL